MKKIILILMFVVVATFVWSQEEALNVITLPKDTEYIIKDKEGEDLLFEVLRSFATTSRCEKSKVDQLAELIGEEAVRKVAEIGFKLGQVYKFPEEEVEKPKERSCGGGFYRTNISFKSYEWTDMTEIIGEIINRSGKDYSMIIFIISTYDKNDKLLSSQQFLMNDLENGQKKSFSELIDVKENEISKYSIKFDTGM